MIKYQTKNWLTASHIIVYAFIIGTIGCAKKIEEDVSIQDRVQTSLKQPSVAAVGIDISSFGANGDGKTDNYAAFQAAAAYAAEHKNITINFPAGTYYIAKYRTKKNDKIDHIWWKNCSGLKLIGQNGTKISMNGSFFRKLDYVTSGGALKSYTSGLSMWFYHCTNLEIRNIELTGNVQNTTRSPGADDASPSVTESNNYLLRFTMCDKVVINNIYVHHSESDGIKIGGDRINGVWTNSSNFKVTNLRSYNNARLGMSIGGLNKSYFKGCEFKYNGFTDGDYGRNDPAGGVDIEPGEFHNNDNIKFEACAFESNYSGHFLCTAPNTTSNITLLNCSIVTGIETPKTQGVTVLAKNVVIDGCIMKLGNRALKVTNPKRPGSTVKITNCKIECSDNVINSNSMEKDDNIIISNNQFTYTENVLTKNFITLQTKNLQFLDNTVFIPSAAIKSRPTGTHVLIQNAIISKGNMFYSDKSGVKPTVSYTGTKIVQDL
ncbi:MAG: glycosyl hydrolase family 28-related protein [Ferruginibacter sp.]